MFGKERAARRAKLQLMWVKYLTDHVSDRTDLEAVRSALKTFILENRVGVRDTKWLIYGDK